MALHHLFATLLCGVIHAVQASRRLLQNETLEVHFNVGNPVFLTDDSTTDGNGRRLQQVLNGYWNGNDLTWNSGCSAVNAQTFASCRDLCSGTFGCTAVSYAAVTAPKCAGSCFLKTSSSESFVPDPNFQSIMVTVSDTDMQRGFLYAGNDLTWQANDCSSVTAVTAEACMQRCTTTPSCAVWSWVIPSSSKCPNSCYLKWAAGQKVSNFDFISGVSGTGSSGGDNSLAGGRCTDASATLAAHNAFRGMHQSTAPLAWDTTLAASAQAYSERLAAAQNCGLQHSGQPGVGENLYSAWGTVGTGMDRLTCQPAVDAWYLDEIGFIDSWSNIGAFMGDARTGHLTQIIWRSTSRVGCGAAVCNRNGMPGRVVTCQYSPPGNFMNTRLWLDNLGAPL